MRWRKHHKNLVNYLIIQMKNSRATYLGCFFIWKKGGNYGEV